MHKKWSEFHRGVQLMQLQLPTGQRPHGINFVLHPAPTNTHLLQQGKPGVAGTQTAGRTQHQPQEHTDPASQAACRSGSWQTCDPRELPRTFSWSSKKVLRVRPTQGLKSFILKLSEHNKETRVEGLLWTLEKHLQTHILSCKMQDLTHWGTWNRDRGGTISYRETLSQTLLACAHWLIPLASLSQNTWVFWELLTSLHLFIICISCRLSGSAGIYMINKRIFICLTCRSTLPEMFLTVLEVYLTAFLVKDYMAILASIKSAKSDLWSWKTGFESLKNPCL